MAVPRSPIGSKGLRRLGFAAVQGCDCRVALLHIETL
ncbi:hypothetical protein PisoF_04541 [Pseudomonas sp. IsoF]|jgi:hypothetical protein|nr:hypothetical protein PisoF_04541 [Pseudomonas sp. IsoF]